MDKCKDVTEWQKGAIVFGRAHGYNEVSGFVGVSQRTVQRVYKQWCNTRGHETRRQKCGRKDLTNHVFAFIQMTHVVEFIEGQMKHFILNVCKVRFKPEMTCTVHRAGRICDWFDEQSYTLLHLDWPAKSPDLNPIANLWDMLEQRVKRQNQHPRNLVDLRYPILSE
ncbi:hypothetical protein AVEN_232523-1 [Araneus ventricosus]|uniref:Tc1-like transposase DDE domain-containing protein n=1 Tax=Araneus ventricosus TaxID=182803 RepID=A0A4Y2SUP2_ARAVE|nr:hypothetical protein AVEN_177653-1 [Araneus ventricosus]GBN91681.1 hypothetical protein AVEN_232523-1 [Araneus ventricosus]